MRIIWGGGGRLLNTKHPKEITDATNFTYAARHLAGYSDEFSLLKYSI